MEKINYKKTLKTITRNTPIKWKTHGFVMLPHALLLEGKVSRSGLLLFWALTIHLFDGKKYCFPGVKTLSKELQYSERHIIRVIKELESAGYLRVERNAGEVNRYYLADKK